MVSRGVFTGNGADKQFNANDKEGDIVVKLARDYGSMK